MKGAGTDAGVWVELIGEKDGIIVQVRGRGHTADPCCGCTERAEKLQVKLICTQRLGSHNGMVGASGQPAVSPSLLS
jgi:hypothetical protein